MRFFKMSAGGNDFIVLDGLAANSEEQSAGLSAEHARRACTRRLSLGADGCILLTPSSKATARFELWNSDGTRAAFSGNGARCAARTLAAMGKDEDGAILLDTEAGLVTTRMVGTPESPRVQVSMAAPRDVRLGVDLPAGSPAPQGDYAVLGVPCLAVPVRDVAAVDIAAVGPPLRHLSLFEDGANVSFYEVPDESGEPTEPVNVRIWERGVEGETLSSGTGCGIVALALAHRQRRESATEQVTEELSFTLRPPSTLLAHVSLRFEGASLAGWSLEGDARFIASGELGPDALAEPA